MKRLFLILLIFCAVFSVSAKNNESLEYLKNISTNKSKIIYMSPRGKLLNFNLSSNVAIGASYKFTRELIPANKTQI